MNRSSVRLGSSVLAVGAFVGIANAVVVLCCVNTYSTPCCTSVGGPASQSGCGLAGHSCVGTITTNPNIVRAIMGQADGGVRASVVGAPPTNCVGVSRTCQLIGCESSAYSAGCPADEACTGNDCRQPTPTPQPIPGTPIKLIPGLTPEHQADDLDLNEYSWL